MKNIYKYFINNDNHIKNKDVMDFSNENSLTQGYFLSRTRKKFLRDLEFNLNHYNKNFVEGFVEGNTSLTTEFEGLNTETIKQINSKLKNSEFKANDKEKIKKAIKNFINKKKEYKNLLAKKEAEYIEFIKDVKKLEKQVLDCKSKCEKDNTVLIDKNACKLGCHLKGPYRANRDCSNTFLPSTTWDCEKAKNTKCMNNKWLPNAGAERDYIDKNNVTLKAGCCECGGGIFGPPKMFINGKYHNNCDDLTVSKEKCKAVNKFSNEFKTQSQLKNKYTQITKWNEQLITLSDELLKNINYLKTKNINLKTDTLDIQKNFKDKNSVHENILDEIKKFTKKQQQTLDLRVKDGILKKNAYEYRNYIWLILAFSLGFAALNKIKDL